MPKLRIDTQIAVDGDWLPGSVLFHNDTPVDVLKTIAGDYRAQLERQHYPVTGVQVVRVHTITTEVIEVVEVVEALGDDPAPVRPSF